MFEKTPKKHKPCDLYVAFTQTSMKQLEQDLLSAETREEKIFCRKLLNLKLQLEQEKVVGEMLM